MKKKKKAWEKCFICNDKLTNRYSILCTSCQRRRHKKCILPSGDRSELKYCETCGADLTIPVEKSNTSFQDNQGNGEMECL